ncbi:MAG: GTP cyclohydrolase I [Helicobacter sp.]|nr:GTP cyclohydrolase I [Helicobacter sp.]
MPDPFTSLFAKIGDDPNREDLKRTPKRLFALWEGLLSGYQSDLSLELGNLIEAPSQDLIRLSKIPFHSICEHHLMPFFGRVKICYLPKNHIAGIAGITRVVKALSLRLQIQERLSNELADFLFEALDPIFLQVDISATHLCLMMQGGVMQDIRSGTKLKTRALRGDAKK